MKKLILIATAVLSVTACQDEQLSETKAPFEMRAASAEYLTVSSLPVTTVSGNITSNTTWSGVIEMDGIIKVKDGAVLTILPGTFIKAKPQASGAPTGILVITKTGKINAVGTENQPIVFTSYNLLDGNEDTVAREGDFGGIMILGDARTNVPFTTEVDEFHGPDYYFGGVNDDHNGGIMKYVRIEFGGSEISFVSMAHVPSLTLGGVGKGTILDHIQVSYAQDDSFKFYGGSVNPSNLISFAAEDDNFDFSFGYTGTINCALSLADYRSAHKVNGGYFNSQGIEVRNNVTGNQTALITHPTFNNLNLIGVWQEPFSRMYDNGIYVRKFGKLTLNNAVITGYPQGIKVEGSGSELLSDNFGSISVHGFNLAVTGAGTAGIPASNLVTALTAPTWGISQPFVNEGTLNFAPRNCGDFQGKWTKYNFAIVQ